MARRDQPTAWHPILDAVEVRVGLWLMIAPHGRKYGEVQLVRRGREIGYRATSTLDETPVVLAYLRTLRGATATVYRGLLTSHGPRGGPVAQWDQPVAPETTRTPPHPPRG